MKILFLLPLIVFGGAHKSTINIFSLIQEDTTIIVHQLDGNMAEWPKEKFKTDEETKMSYAVDNDKQTLFLAVSVSDKNIQQKILQDGMNLYIDMKAKKKENKGIEFPVKIGDMASVQDIRLFGFGDGEPFLQGLRAEGSANIAIAWDSNFVINIEYNIPLKMLGETLADLNNKKISIGWKLKDSGMPAATPQNVTTTSQLVAVPADSGPLRNRNVTGANPKPAPQPTPSKTTSFWTWHTIML